jgi:hypothetical protein
MKKNLFVLIVISFIVVTTSAQQANNQKNNPVGTWKFEAPYAPEGYTSGTIVVGLEDQKHTTSMAFAGSEYKLPGENVKAVNDSILFSIYMEGQDIKVMLKIENETKMSGKAVYSEGEVPLTLTKVVAVEPEVK